MVLCSTTSLAYGVNLPARRVFIKDSFKAYDSPENRITPTEYKQMSGRAGRAGIDTEGESILMVRPDSKNREQLRTVIQVRQALRMICMRTDNCPCTVCWFDKTRRLMHLQSINVCAHICVAGCLHPVSECLG